MRIGIGWDLHRLRPEPNSSIPLGGVPIPADHVVEAHSDGDVVLHAVVDACLGALALGDIGQLFPDTAEENRKRPSAEFVEHTLALLKERGWKVAQVDTIIQAQTPKIGPHREAIQRRVAELLNLELTEVGIKAKTFEELGPIGEKKAIAAHAAVTLDRI